MAYSYPPTLGRPRSWDDMTPLERGDEERKRKDEQLARGQAAGDLNRANAEYGAATAPPPKTPEQLEQDKERHRELLRHAITATQAALEGLGQSSAAPAAPQQQQAQAHADPATVAAQGAAAKSFPAAPPGGGTSDALLERTATVRKNNPLPQAPPGGGESNRGEIEHRTLEGIGQNMAAEQGRNDQNRTALAGALARDPQFRADTTRTAEINGRMGAVDTMQREGTTVGQYQAQQAVAAGNAIRQRQEQAKAAQQQQTHAAQTSSDRSAYQEQLPRLQAALTKLGPSAAPGATPATAQAAPAPARNPDQFPPNLRMYEDRGVKEMQAQGAPPALAGQPKPAAKPQANPEEVARLRGNVDAARQRYQDTGVAARGGRTALDVAQERDMRGQQARAQTDTAAAARANAEAKLTGGGKGGTTGTPFNERIKSGNVLNTLKTDIGDLAGTIGTLSDSARPDAVNQVRQSLAQKGYNLSGLAPNAPASQVRQAVSEIVAENTRVLHLAGSGMGYLPNKPIDVPEGVTKNRAMHLLIPGIWYRNKSGHSAMWDGRAFVTEQ